MTSQAAINDTFHHSSLSGKVAVITGSTQGLGEATARLFQQRGIRGLIITGRNVERGEQVAKSLTNDVCTAHFVPADLENLEDCRRIIQAADDHFGTLHILVNSAAWTARSSVWDTTPEMYDKMMNINSRAPFFLMQYAIRIMERDHVEGSIVNISSTASYGGMPMIAPYSISKGTLNVMSKHFAYAVMPSRIRVNALAIGWMDTPGEDVVQRQFHHVTDDWKDKGAARLPFGRLLDPNEVARCIAYCASDESGMMTGCIIDFDQSVVATGPASVPPPKERFDQADGVKFSF
jgi:NAD(P)-dependent dehydrogenase (short-subunit alcohol dehydrogenase family)